MCFVSPTGATPVDSIAKIGSKSQGRGRFSAFLIAKESNAMSHQRLSSDHLLFSFGLPRLRSAAILVAFGLIFLLQLQSQGYKVIYQFTGGAGGANPNGGVTMDVAGNLYGTTQIGGYFGGDCGRSWQFPGCGTVFKLTPAPTAWNLRSLYAFNGAPDGAIPSARVVFGSDGWLYGTTWVGGMVMPHALTYYTPGGCGTAFALEPTQSGTWTEHVLHRFGETGDGAMPTTADLTFDQAGVVYGTTDGGGGCQGRSTTVFSLTRSGAGWMESILHRFTGGTDGSCSWAGVTFDKHGNLYGTTCFGGYSNGCGGIGCGTVFQLTPSSDGWTKSIIYSFSGSDGSIPYGGVIFDEAGNLYGTTLQGGATGGGTVFRLTPSDGGWTYSLIYSFTDTGGPSTRLVMDVVGDLFGTTSRGGPYGWGNVFKLTPTANGYMYRSLHDFTGGSDGGYGYNNSSPLVLDRNGNLFGTAIFGGDPSCSFGCGLVYEITP
jgi:uncharacterized repeat protein (TIGR03803 family)